MATQAAQWTPHPRLDDDLKPLVQKVIDGIPQEHLEPPSPSETFDVPDDAWTRLQNYAFSQGFAIVTGSCGAGRKSYQCIHAEEKTQNNRKLDEHTGEGSNRQQELTRIKKKGCPWRCAITWRDPHTRGGDNKTWVLGLGHQDHSHEMVPNPLSYNMHKKRQPDYAKAVELARANRASNLTYNQSEAVLDNTTKDWDDEFHLNKKKYYNLIPSTTRSREDVLTGLLAALDSPTFTAKVRYSYVKDMHGTITKRILEQIVLIDNFQRRLAKRFCSGFLMENDATFNTNAQKLLLFVAVGITNTNKSFPVAFSFATSESEAAFNYFLDTLKEEIFNDCPLPKVSLSDQGKGYIASLKTRLPDCQIQLCSWHAVQNIRSRVNKSRRGYPVERRDEIVDASWNWVKCDDPLQLPDCRQALLDLLHDVDKEYFYENWDPKEASVVTCLTRNYRNLGSHSTQRNEGMHPILKAVLNPQKTLQNAVRDMNSELRRWYRSIREEVEASRIDRPRGVDMVAFSIVVGKITIWAIEKVNPEWIATKQWATEIATNPAYIPEEGPCNCYLMTAFALPCRHYLLRACIEGFPIPLSLFHPRWWIDDIPTPHEWSPRYYDQTLAPGDNDPSMHRDHGRNTFLAAAASLQSLHTALPRAQADQLANQLATFQANVTTTHEALQQRLQGIPTELPQPPPTRKAQWATMLQEKKKHGKANARKLTGAEMSEKTAVERDQKATNEAAISTHRVHIVGSSSSSQSISGSFESQPAFRPPPPPPLSPVTVLSSSQIAFRRPPSPPLLNAPVPKQRGRPKGSKNKPSAPSILIDEPPPSSAPAALTTTRHGRPVKEKKVWEQEKGHSQSWGQRGRQRGDSLEAELSPPKKKKSKTNLVDAIDVDEWESQEQRRLQSAFVVED